MTEPRAIQRTPDQIKHQLALDPNNLEALAELYNYHMSRQEWADAEIYLKKVEHLDPKSVEVKLYLGSICQTLKRHEEALIWYQRVIALYPRHIEAINNTGHMYLILGQKSEAKKYFEKAIQTNPESIDAAEAYSNLGILFVEEQQINEAIHCFHQALKLRPEFYYLYLNLAHAYNIKKDFDSAIQILEQMPYESHLEIEKNIELSKIYRKKNEIYTAISILEKSLKENPDHPFLNYEMGKIHVAKKNYEKSKIYFQKAAANAPHNIDLLMDLASYAHEQKEFTLAKKYLEDILNIDPSNATAYSHLGYICCEEGNPDGAINCCELALALSPNSALPHRFLGMAYYQKGNNELSAAHFLRALELSPDDPDILANLGSLYRGTQMGRLTRKLCYNSIKPLIEQYENRTSDKDLIYFTSGQASAISQYAFNCLVNCFWEEYKKIEPLLKIIICDQLAEGVPLGISPYISQFTLDTETQKIITRQLAERNEASASQKYKVHKRHSPSKLRIGYISPDFNGHVVGFLIGDLFSHHDRSQFEIYAYSLRNKYDTVRNQIEKSVDHFIDFSMTSNQEAAKKIHDDQIDILVDLAGYTAGSRPKILGFCPAPIQAQFIGQAGTMGANYIHYHLNTAYLVPADQLPLYSEQIVYLPEAPIAVERYTIPEKLPDHESYDLPRDQFIFCCFNNLYRLNETLFACWMKILHAVPNSILWLSYLSEEAIENLSSQAEKHGIDRKRLVFRPHIKLNEDWHHRLADLYLDTTLISGGTTGILSAWAGLPVLTLFGDTPQAMYGAGIMAAVGMDEMIVHSHEEYVDRAIEIAKNPQKLKIIKDKLNQNRLSSTLFNQARWIKQLEHAYQLMWEDHQQGHPHKVIEVPRES